MAIPASPPLLVPKVRTTTIGGRGGEVVQSRMATDLLVQGRGDIEWYLKRITYDETAQQIKLGNPPSNIVVDGSESKSFDQAKRRVVVQYGSRLATAAMRLVETVLRRNINRATNSISGRLADVSGSWRWKLVQPGGATRVVNAASTLPSFVRGVMLILEPFNVPHATVANRRSIAGSGLRSRKRQRLGAGVFGPSKPKAQIGFLRATVEAVRARAEFRDFDVTVVFSKAFAVPGELSRLQGTGSIVIKTKRSRFR